MHHRFVKKYIYISSINAAIKHFTLTFPGTFAIAYVYSAEIYPTVVRSAGMGSSSLMARLGGLVAPYVAAAAKSHIGRNAPILVFGVTAFVAGTLALFLPETMGRKLPDTIDESEKVKISLRDGMERDKN